MDRAKVRARRQGPAAQRAAAVSKAMADGGSCRQQACGRETVCQRDRSILKSPVTLARSGHLYLPRSLDRQVPRSLFVCLAPSGTQEPFGPPRATENARLNPDSQPAKPGWLPRGSRSPFGASPKAGESNWSDHLAVCHADVSNSLTMTRQPRRPGCTLTASFHSGSPAVMASGKPPSGRGGGLMAADTDQFLISVSNACENFPDFTSVMLDTSTRVLI